MKLLHQDSQATDPLYHKIQKNNPHFDPPTLLKDQVEELYKICHNLLDKKFPSQIKHDFASCYSELYFCATFIKRLHLNVTHPSDKGPDFYIQELDCWAEVVTISNGEKDNPNSIPQVIYKVASDNPSDKIILRITSSFTSKAEKILQYIKKGLIKDSQRIIICISGGWIEPFYRLSPYPVGGFPEVVRALLPIGDMVLVINKDNKIIEKKFEYRDNVSKAKRNKEIQPIETDYFIDPKYSFISGVVYSYANITDSIKASDLGRDFFIIHNPLAKHPVPLKSIKCGTEYKIEIESDLIKITPIKHERKSSTRTFRVKNSSA